MPEGRGFSGRQKGETRSVREESGLCESYVRLATCKGTYRHVDGKFPLAEFQEIV